MEHVKDSAKPQNIAQLASREKAVLKVSGRLPRGVLASTDATTPPSEDCYRALLHKA